MKLLADHETSEKEPTIFQKMTLGHSFKEDRNIFKSIHSLLRKPKRSEEDHHSSSDQGDSTIHNTSPECSLQIEQSPSKIKIGDSVCNASPSPSRDIAGQWPESDMVSEHASSNVQEMTLRISPTSSLSRCTSSERSMASSREIEPGEDDIFLHTLLPPQVVKARPQRRTSHNSVGSSGACRTTRSANAISGKRDGKSMRGSRTSLHRMNSVDVCHRDYIASPQEEQQSKVPPRKSYNSMIAQSGIPYYNQDGSSGDHFPRITAETLKSIIQDEIYKSHYESYQVIDCRFDYEFRGGHICNALNLSSREDLERELIHNYQKLPTLLIFHCEFSSYRGPLLASHLRNCDRMLNYENYPELFYPDILVLEGGYKGFFDQFPNLCFPRRYVGMDSSDNLANRDQELERFRSDSKKVVSRNSSLHKLTSVSSSTRSSIKHCYQEKNNSCSRLDYNTSPGFKYEAPPKLSISRYSNDNPFANSDDSSSGSRLSINSSPNWSSSKMLLTDGLDADSSYSLEEGDSTFTTPVAMVDGPINQERGSEDALTETSAFHPIKKSLFTNILREEEEDTD